MGTYGIRRRHPQWIHVLQTFYSRLSEFFAIDSYFGSFQAVVMRSYIISLSCFILQNPFLVAEA